MVPPAALAGGDRAWPWPGAWPGGWQGRPRAFPRRLDASRRTAAGQPRRRRALGAARLGQAGRFSAGQPGLDSLRGRAPGEAPVRADRAHPFSQRRRGARQPDCAGRAARPVLHLVQRAVVRAARRAAVAGVSLAGLPDSIRGADHHRWMEAGPRPKGVEVPRRRFHLRRRRRAGPRLRPQGLVPHRVRPPMEWHFQPDRAGVHLGA